MKRIRIVGLCLVAVFAISAVAASSASAGSILYVPRGGVFPVHYSGLVTTKTKLETSGGKTIECGDIHILGNLINVHLSITHYLFLGCTGLLGSVCTSAGSPSGDISIELHEHLGLIDDPSGNLFNDPGILDLVVGVKFKCKAGFIEEAVEVEGTLIGQITSPAVNTFSKTSEIKYTAGATKGSQLFTLFLSPLLGTVHALESTKVGTGSKEDSNEQGSGKIEYAGGEEVEIKLQ